jgi:hypothetical protein
MKEWDGEKEDEPEQQIQLLRACICTNNQQAQSGESDDKKTSTCFRNGDRKGKAQSGRGRESEEQAHCEIFCERSFSDEDRNNESRQEETNLDKHCNDPSTFSVPTTPTKTEPSTKKPRTSRRKQ